MIIVIPPDGGIYSGIKYTADNTDNHKSIWRFLYSSMYRCTKAQVFAVAMRSFISTFYKAVVIFMYQV